MSEAAPLARPLRPPFRTLPPGLVIAESLTLRPVVRAWAVGPGGRLLVARDQGGPHLAELGPDRRYRRRAALPHPAHRIYPVPGGWTWLRCWPGPLAERAGGRPFARELQPVGPRGRLGPLLTVTGALVEVLPAGDRVLVVSAGGTLSAHAPDGTRLWARAVPGWPASPESRVWIDQGGQRIWSSERDGLTELSPDGVERWAWRAPSPGAFALEPDEVVRAAATTLGVAPDTGPSELRRAYRRRAFETHPDRHPGLPGAEELFKAVAHAYAVLTRTGERDREQGHPLGSAFLRVTGAWPAGPGAVWVATADGGWFRLQDGRACERGALPRQAPATLAVGEDGRLLARGQAGQLWQGEVPVPMPPGWGYQLRRAGDWLVAYGRDRLVTVDGAGRAVGVELDRPAQTVWAGEELHLFFPEGDCWRLRPGNPAPPASPP